MIEIAEDNEVEKVIGDCKVCKLKIIRYSYRNMTPYNYCSDFCSETTEKEKIDFLSASSGDFVTFPCAKCGVCLQDEWNSDPDKSLCSSCHKKIKSELQSEIIVQQTKYIEFLSHLIEPPRLEQEHNDYVRHDQAQRDIISSLKLRLSKL